MAAACLEVVAAVGLAVQDMASEGTTDVEDEVEEQLA